jgi:HD-like signal output (HDOD) protein
MNTQKHKMTRKTSLINFHQGDCTEQDSLILKDYLAAQPGLSSNVIELLESVKETFQTNLSSFAEEVKKDDGLVEKVLKTARSSSFIRMVRVDTINDAIQLLGVEKFRDIALFPHWKSKVKSSENS